jgi:hypothetical protein
LKERYQVIPSNYHGEDAYGQHTDDIVEGRTNDIRGDVMNSCRRSLRVRTKADTVPASSVASELITKNQKTVVNRKANGGRRGRLKEWKDPGSRLWLRHRFKCEKKDKSDDPAVIPHQVSVLLMGARRNLKKNEGQ